MKKQLYDDLVTSIKQAGKIHRGEANASRTFAAQSEKKPELTESQIDALIIAEAHDPSAWGDPITVPASKSPRPAWMVRGKPQRKA